MLQTINANPGISAIVAIAAVGTILAICLFITNKSYRASIRRERGQLLERIARESEQQRNTIALLNQGLSSSARQIAELSSAMEARQDRLRGTLDERIDALQRSNEKKLDQMRDMVGEKLQSTLEGRLGESFKVVNDQLARVHKGLGEMQSLAANVGDLKKVLTNVKTRGVWGEVQLRALLEQTLTVSQYIENAQITAGSQERVEFAIKLPAREGEGPLLPIDSKFPQEDYLRLIDAADSGDRETVEKCAQQLERAVVEQAKKISEKYIKPPVTADFAILFLPVESLYAEVIRRNGLTENLQSKYRVMVAGPSTLAALLNSLQMGFRTCALEQRSGEVLKLLGSVRLEFTKFEGAVQKARQRLAQADSDLDGIDTRTRAINRRLRDIGEDGGGELPDGKESI